MHTLSCDWNSDWVGEISFCLLLEFGQWFLTNAEPMGLHLFTGTHLIGVEDGEIGDLMNGGKGCKPGPPLTIKFLGPHNSFHKFQELLS